jgi:hypothetical protein
MDNNILPRELEPERAGPGRCDLDRSRYYMRESGQVNLDYVLRVF